jgi:hypothetical protein
MVVILSPQTVEKSLLEIYRFNLSTDFGGVQKIHSDELKMRFMPTAPIYRVWYIRNLLTGKTLLKEFLI